ncbi:phosphotransferase [Mycobacterium sp.]|uniref:phosphotransferase n=1 Tax=Mycobacterium sp. TaxID=1785 RepID=UPI001201B04A|nr:phosphotransferase [Mycobacterium sp.]TAM65795.1 MAG: DUF1679 domain-containing protein [Mycobacterium sp.]
MAARLDFAKAVARVAGIRLYERIRPRGVVTNSAVVPARIEELTPEWLTGALCSAHPGARVTDFTLGGGSDGTSSRRAITVSYNPAGAAAGLPTAIFAKSTPSMVNRLLVGVTGAAGAEALFYSRIRPELKIGAPAGYFGGWDPRTCRSMILTEDVAVNRGAVFADASTMYVDRLAAEGMVREMASYHGQLWEDPRLDSTWTSLLTTESWQRDFNAKTKFDAGAILGMRLAADEVPAAIHSRKKELRPALAKSLALNAAGPRTLVHQDVHPANWFRLPDGSFHLYDWQGIAKGNWAIDFSYAISAALTTTDRREWEQDLLRLYLDELAIAGGKAPRFDQAWLAYRQQMMHGFIFWTYTFLIGKVSTLQPDAHVRLLIRRIGQAAVDLQTLDSLR